MIKSRRHVRQIHTTPESMEDVKVSITPAVILPMTNTTGREKRRGSNLTKHPSPHLMFKGKT